MQAAAAQLRWRPTLLTASVVAPLSRRKLRQLRAPHSAAKCSGLQWDFCATAKSTVVKICCIG